MAQRLEEEEVAMGITDRADSVSSSLVLLVSSYKHLGHGPVHELLPNPTQFPQIHSAYGPIATNVQDATPKLWRGQVGMAESGRLFWQRLGCIPGLDRRNYLALRPAPSRSSALDVVIGHSDCDPAALANCNLEAELRVALEAELRVASCNPGPSLALACVLEALALSLLSTTRSQLEDWDGLHLGCSRQ